MKRKFLNIGKMERVIFLLLSLKLTIEAQDKSSGVPYRLLRNSVAVMGLLCRNIYNQLDGLHSTEWHLQGHGMKKAEPKRSMDVRFKQKYTREPIAAWSKQVQLSGRSVHDINGLAITQGNKLARK